MPRWIVSCSECGEEFTHTLISLLGVPDRDPFASPPKPQFPAAGTELNCPNCGKTSNYKAFDLRYRAD